jgi:hypothetical protein
MQNMNLFGKNKWSWPLSERSQGDRHDKSGFRLVAEADDFMQG